MDPNEPPRPDRRAEGDKPAPPSIFERNPRKAIAAIVAVLLVATDLAFTRVERALVPRRSLTASGVRLRSDVFHHGFVPLSRGKVEWGPRLPQYEINSLGLRDESAREVPLQAEGRRLLFIGDSFTEGIGVEYGETFAGIVARDLRPRGVEVLNAGCASYSPIIYYRKVRWLLDQGLRFDELAVYVDMSDVQDEVTYHLGGDGNVVSDERRRLREERQNIRYSLPAPLRNLAARQFLKRHTTALFALYELLENAVKDEGHRAALWTVDPRLYEEFAREGLARARGNMDLLAELLGRHGIRLTVAVYPWPDQIRRGDLHSMQASYWRQWALSRDAGFIDYFPRFIGSRPAPDVLAQLFIPGDNHWNEAGHRVIAEGFIEYWRGR